jgi:hypothetical protein
MSWGRNANDDVGFITRYESACCLCRRLIAAGSRARTVGQGEYAHHQCPSADVVVLKTTLVHQGKAACDAYGNVMARLTEDGWAEVEAGGQAERTDTGVVFPVR